MSSSDEDNPDMNDVEIDVKDGSDDTEVKTTPKPKHVENETVTPLEDRFGQSLWVVTRYCHCPDNAFTDCRFHGQDEPGWEKCPYEDASKKGRTKGRSLWARNSNYGKPQATANEEREELPEAAVS
jgi:hypothetical protein